MKAKNPVRSILFAVGVLLISAACSTAVVSSSSDQTPPEVDQELVGPTEAADMADEPSEPMASYSCSYELVLPDEMTKQQENAHSAQYSLGDESSLTSFIYVSVIDKAIMGMVAEGSYEYEVYNYDPAETELLLTMPVGESKPVREVADTAEWFTYERLADVQIAGHTAQEYVNLKPWEFPEGTKEVRYYLQLDDCTFLIGAYLVTIPSDRPGIITEELFQEVLASLQLNQ